MDLFIFNLIDTGKRLLKKRHVKFLPANSSFIHQSAFGVDKYSHPFIIPDFCLNACGRTGTGASCAAVTAGLSLDPCSDHYG